MTDGAPRLTEPLDDDAEAMGAIIRRRRKRLGLTLKAVAQESGLSNGFISLVERGRTRPSLPSFTRLAAALRTTPVDLFAELSAMSRSPFPLYGGGGGRVVHSEPRKIRIMEVRIDTHGSHGMQMHSDYSEFLYILEGELEVIVEDQISTLRIGESIHYPPGARHNWSSTTDDPCRMLLIHYY